MSPPDASPRERGEQNAVSRRLVQVLLGVALVTVAFAAPVRPHSDAGVHWGGGDDTCLAQVVGLVESQVLWFDGIPFFERTDGQGDTYLYVTEAGAPDPTHHVGPGTFDAIRADAAENGTTVEPEAPFLVRSGTHYDFTDANNVTWNVTEAYFDVPAHETNRDHESSRDHAKANDSARGPANRYFVWIVRVGEERQDENIGVPTDVGDGGSYNFATRVNTTKFTTPTREEGRNVTHENGTSTMGSDLCHPEHTHHHRRYEAGLWVGRSPDLVPLDCEPVHEVDASFFAEYDAFSADGPHVEGTVRGGTCTGLEDGLVSGLGGGAP